MNEGRIFLCLCIVLFGAVGCYNEPQLQSTSLQVEERAKLSIQGLKNLARTEDFKAGIPGFVGNLGGIKELIHINYSAPPKQVIKAVGDAIVPMISAGLLLIPGGALISGIVDVVWGIFSGLFGGPAAKSPMEIMIDDMKTEIDTIKNDVAKLKASLNVTIQKHLDETLSKIITRAINGELRRNEYVCSKYAVLSGEFSYKLQNNLSINESIRTEMVAQIHDCDDFLKDTTEAFAYQEFADVLWVANVITTLVRVSFLTEVSNYGVALGIDQKILLLFWSEIKADLKKVFEFYTYAVAKKARITAPMNYYELTRLGNFTTAEYEGCVMQAQLLYLDREIYPHGVPQYFRIFDEDSELKVADYNVTDGDEPRHIQVYYNEVYLHHSKSTTTLFNCFMGPDRVTRVPKQKMSFRITYVKNKTYEMRVLYFAEDKVDRKLTVTEESGNNYVVTIRDGYPSEESVKRYVFKTAFLHLMDPRFRLPYWYLFLAEPARHQTYSYSSTKSIGAYVVETVFAFTVQPNDESMGKIDIIAEGLFSPTVYIFGVEIIVLQLSEEL